MRKLRSGLLAILLASCSFNAAFADEKVDDKAEEYERMNPPGMHSTLLPPIHFDPPPKP